LPHSDFENYYADESNLKGLSDSRIPGLEVTSGSLGHGFSVGVGMALAAKLKKTDQKVFVVVGDGEINEGPIWEGALFAAHHELNNFMVIVDENGFQAMGPTKDILDLASIEKKFTSFGFDAISVDGHDELALDMAIQTLMDRSPGQPKALIAKTIKGKGVPFMESNNAWHYTRLNDSSYEDAIAALKKESE
jgi:transketolase